MVDEWQEVPSTWDAARRAVDAAGDRGLFILTGSSTPAKDSVTHSGAGRIARVDMNTMTLWERGPFHRSRVAFRADLRAAVRVAVRP